MLNPIRRPRWRKCSRIGWKRTNPPGMSPPSLWKFLIQTTLRRIKTLSWTCSRRRLVSRRSVPCAMLFVLQWCESYLSMTLNSASFKCLLLDMTLIRTIVIFIGSLKLSLLVPPDMHGLNGRIQRRTDSKLLKLGMTTAMVPVCLVSAPVESLHYKNDRFMCFERYTQLLTKWFSTLYKDIDKKFGHTKGKCPLERDQESR